MDAYLSKLFTITHNRATGSHDTDNIFKVIGSKVKVTDNTYTKCFSGGCILIDIIVIVAYNVYIKTDGQYTCAFNMLKMQVMFTGVYM